MMTSVVRGLVAGVLCAAAWTAAAPTRALADEQLEMPPAAFGAPPPDHQPGSSEYVPGSTPEPRSAAVEGGLPAFITLDRSGTTSHAGIQVGFNKFDGVDLDDGFAMRFNPYGEYFFPNRIVAIYGQIAVAHLFNFEGDDGTALGNLELGGLYLPTGDSRLILRAGLALPTASDADNLADFAANVGTSYERLTDAVLLAPESTTLRLSASTIQQFDNFFLRADGGFDLIFSRPGTAADNASVFFRANIAAGIRASGVDFALELVNIAALNGDNLDGISERFMHTAAVSVRTHGEDQFQVGAVFPLDESARGGVWILSLGYMRAFN